MMTPESDADSKKQQNNFYHTPICGGTPNHSERRRVNRHAFHADVDRENAPCGWVHPRTWPFASASTVVSRGARRHQQSSRPAPSSRLGRRPHGKAIVRSSFAFPCRPARNGTTFPASHTHTQTPPTLVDAHAVRHHIVGHPSKHPPVSQQSALRAEVDALDPSSRRVGVVHRVADRGPSDTVARPHTPPTSATAPATPTFTMDPFLKLNAGSTQNKAPAGEAILAGEEAPTTRVRFVVFEPVGVSGPAWTYRASMSGRPSTLLPTHTRPRASHLPSLRHCLSSGLSASGRWTCASRTLQKNSDVSASSVPVSS